MTLTDLINNAFEASKERIKNPLIGSFVTCFIIYNWRPILLLLFSDANIEDKIVVINHEYCNLLAILVPLLFAILYTMYFPHFTVSIDKNLELPMKDRIDNQYLSKEHTLDKRITIAKKEFLAKDIESGNLDIGEMQKDIENLKQNLRDEKEINSEMRKSDKLLIDTLNMQLRDITSDQLFKDVNYKKKYEDFELLLKKYELSFVEYANLLKVFSKMDKADFDVLLYLSNHLHLKYSELDISHKKLEKLVSLELIDLTGADFNTKTNGIIITDLGKDVIDKFEDINY